MITMNVVKKLAVLREVKGYSKELRIVSWNQGEPKLDIREWKPDGKCGSGITLSDEEGQLLLEALEKHYSEEYGG